MIDLYTNGTDRCCRGSKMGKWVLTGRVGVFPSKHILRKANLPPFQISAGTPRSTPFQPIKLPPPTAVSFLPAGPSNSAHHLQENNCFLKQKSEKLGPAEKFVLRRRLENFGLAPNNVGT